MIAAVVNHGPSLRNADPPLGEEIDSADLVVRMRNCNWQGELPEVYGRKYDVGIYCPGQPMLHAGQRLPSIRFIRYCPKGTPEKWAAHFPERIGGVPVLDYSEFLTLLMRGLCPGRFHWSRGTAAAVVVMLFVGVEELRIYGADKVSGIQCEVHHPPELRQAHPTTGQVDLHNWEKEREVIELIARTARTKLAWK